METPINIEGTIKTLGNTLFMLNEKKGFSISTKVYYVCKENITLGQFEFYGFLGEEVIGRKFEFKGDLADGLNIPVNQFLRVWNPNGSGCRDYQFIDRRQFLYEKKQNN